MKVMVPRWVFLSTFLICVGSAEDEGRCTLVDDHFKNNLHESLCYVKCLSEALSKLYSNGERRLLVNEEVYANASRILDDMEGKTGESTTYLSVISSVMDGKHDKLEKLIYYGNEMGDLVAKVGGLFSEVNESVRSVRKEMPGSLIKTNKYYTAIAEIVRTVWDDVKAAERDDAAECKDQNIQIVKELPTTCSDQTCPLVDAVGKNALQKYKDGCIEIIVQKAPGRVRKCFNLPRNSLYSGGAVKDSSDKVQWKKEEADQFQLTLHVQQIFDLLTGSFTIGKQPSELLFMMSNFTSFYNRFCEIHENFTSLLFDTNLSDGLNSRSTA
uniref:Expression site-associated gene (ESAG), putative expression site-associated protein 1 (ESAG1), putative n=1 Tax=Trypanosoma brucei brucei (strain 927/4 GUTat10.1) TaxID=185431 RepID=Q4FKJ9_TRYB2|nr:expression site-associated gene (ESAG), putative; expression site-associated protein 1 (ESAG1), putative [Trypanosoma brucei brucei TREU927]